MHVLFYLYYLFLFCLRDLAPNRPPRKKGRKHGRVHEAIDRNELTVSLSDFRLVALRWNLVTLFDVFQNKL